MKNLKHLLLGAFLATVVIVAIAAGTWNREVVSGEQTFNAVITTATSTDLIAAKANVCFRVSSIEIVSQSADANNVYIHSGGTALWGTAANPQPFDMSSIAGIAGIQKSGQSKWIETPAANTALTIVTSAAKPLLVHGTYVEVR